MTTYDFISAFSSLTGKPAEAFVGPSALAKLAQDASGDLSVAYWDASLGAEPTIAQLIAAAAVSPIPASVSRRQFYQAAAQEGLITNADALAIFATGAIPANLATALATIPAADQFAAEIAILGNATFERANPLVAELGAAMGQSPAQIDALFTLAATL